MPEWERKRGTGWKEWRASSYVRKGNKPQTNPTLPQLMMAHVATTLMTLWWLSSCLKFRIFYSSQFFHPVLHHLPKHPAPPSIILHPSFRSLSIVWHTSVRPPCLRFHSQKAGVWQWGINLECSLVMTHPQMARRSTRRLPRSAPVTNKEPSEAVKLNSFTLTLKWGDLDAVMRAVAMATLTHSVHIWPKTG